MELLYNCNGTVTVRRVDAKDAARPHRRVTAFALHPAIDPAACAARYQREGHVRIAQWLSDDSAQSLSTALARERAWRHVIHAPSRDYEIARADLEGLAPEQRARVDDAVVEAARDGFQFRYDSVRVSDDPAERRARGSALDAFADFMNSDTVLARLAAISGATGALFVDAQATAYRPGDFLTAHDDDVAGKHRQAAFVFGLTQRWRTEWGGLLMLHGSDGAGRYLTPAFNTLDLFAVPQVHSVSLVAPWADRPRLSVTGWLRRGHEQAHDLSR